MMGKVISNFDKYNREARIYPTVLGALPLYIFGVLLAQSLPNFNFYLKLALGFLIPSVVVYVLSDIVRNLGKNLESKIFNNETIFPTTELLLHSNTSLSKEKKDKIYKKIDNDFSITLSNKSEEDNDIQNSRKKIKEAVGQIRQALGNERLLLQYNIRYGFWRNLCAISPFSLFLCLLVAFIVLLTFSNLVYVAILVAISPLYLILWIFNKQILVHFGYQYAEQFYLEFLAK